MVILRKNKAKALLQLREIMQDPEWAALIENIDINKIQFRSINLALA